jgi:guanylate kinase
MHYTSKNFPVLIIIGPSGSGKSTIIRKLSTDQRVMVVPTWTTRQPRPDEKTNGIEHTFVSESEFHEAKEKGLLLVTKQMFGLPFWYGLPVIHKPKDDVVPLIVLRESLIDVFSEHYPNYLIYQIEDTLPRVNERLMARKIYGEEVGERLDNYEKEVKAGRKLAKRVFVNEGTAEEVAKELQSALIEDFAI